MLNKIVINWKPDKSSGEPIYRQIVNYFVERINCGDWVTGQVLPSQRRLSEIFEVNRSTIIEAMEILNSAGLITSEYRNGTRIAANTWDSLLSKSLPEWQTFIESGKFLSNQSCVQVINHCEFDPTFLRLGTGEMSEIILPAEQIQQAMARLVPQKLYIRYSNPLGLEELRNLLCEHLREIGINTNPNCILIVAGALQGLQLIAASLIRDGTYIYTSPLSYINSINVFQSSGAQLKELSSDREGLSLWTTIRETNSLIYTNPCFHNPTGKNISQKRREEILNFCQRHRIPLIEDDVFRDLWLDKKPPAPIKSLDTTGNVIYIGSASKCFSPGLRIGWVVAPESVISRLTDVKMQMDYGVSTISQQLMSELLESGLYAEGMSVVRSRLRFYREHFFQYMTEYFSDLADWEIPEGGFSAWIHLKNRLSSQYVFQEALKNKLLITPGTLFGKKYDSYIRLCYGYLPLDELEDGLRRLAEIIRNAMTKSQPGT